MEVCNACHIQLSGAEQHCPLCGAELAKTEEKPIVKAVNHYPNLRRQLARYNWVRRVLLFVTIFGCLFSALVNFLVTPNFWWSLFVVAAAAYGWILIPALLRRSINFARQIVFQVLLTGAAVILVDIITGYKGWSVSYVLPAVLSAGIVATGLMALFNRTSWYQYVFYQALVCVFGFTPLILYLCGLAGSLTMVLLSAGLAMASLILTVLFADKTIKNEFIKRFHI